LSSTFDKVELEEAWFIPLSLVVDPLKAKLGQAPYDSPLTRPGCSLPNIVRIYGLKREGG